MAVWVGDGRRQRSTAGATTCIARGAGRSSRPTEDRGTRVLKSRMSRVVVLSVLALESVRTLCTWLVSVCQGLVFPVCRCKPVAVAEQT